MTQTSRDGKVARQEVAEICKDPNHPDLKLAQENLVWIIKERLTS